MRFYGLTAVVTLALGVSACAPPASEGGFHSDNPSARLYAIHRAGQERDRTAIPQLVEQLESDDPAVRMFAIVALERITGQRMGYNPYRAAPKRWRAVQAWKQAVRQGRFPASQEDLTRRRRRATHRIEGMAQRRDDAGK